MSINGTAERSVGDAVREPTIAEIISATCEVFDLDRRLLMSHRRSRSVVRPRQLAMFLARRMTCKSMPEIGQGFGRDHTTVLHACNVVPGFLERDDAYRERMNRIEAIALQHASLRPKPVIQPLDIGDITTLVTGLRTLSLEASRVANILQTKAGDPYKGLRFDNN